MCTPPGTPWTKLLEEATKEYNNTPHDVTKFPPNYLMYGKLPYDPPIDLGNIYPPLEEARKIAYENTKKDYAKNKIRYDKRFLESPFKVGDVVMVENFRYPHTRKLEQIFDGPYTIINKISDVTFEIDKPNQITGKKSDILHSTRLRFFNAADKFELKPRHSNIPIKDK
ncbi:retrovirus-like pol polyprotein [Lasius niger]|uniref:Retrovirus-like pol polyprotein n=1 Tax=Lasius niger TaxID=67767 RepID=A0A0J7JV28_LASNI|nr:retrovirus-like pol polyprotein [Lasius niger]